MRVVPQSMSRSVFVQGGGSGHGEGFGCVRPGVIEQVLWGNTPPTSAFKYVWVARGLSWRLVKRIRFRLGINRRELPPEVRDPFARC